MQCSIKQMCTVFLNTKFKKIYTQKQNNFYN